MLFRFSCQEEVWFENRIRGYSLPPPIFMVRGVTPQKAWHDGLVKTPQPATKVFPVGWVFFSQLTKDEEKV
jgi:hypothetical protein